MTLIPDRDFCIREVPLPFGVNGCVTPNADDDGFSIYINSRLSEDQKRKALAHEVDHIENDDFYNDLPISEIEKKDRHKTV